MIAQDKYMRKWFELGYPVFANNSHYFNILWGSLTMPPLRSSGCFCWTYRTGTWHLGVNKSQPQRSVRPVRFFYNGRQIVNTQGARRMGPRRVLRRSQTKGQISDTFSLDGNSRMRQSSCKTLIKACPIKSAPTINDFNLSVCWNTQGWWGSCLICSGWKKKKKAADCNAAAVKWLMLIIYGNRHVCAPSVSFGPCTHTHAYTGYTLDTNPRAYIPVPEWWINCNTRRWKILWLVLANMFTIVWITTIPTDCTLM